MGTGTALTTARAHGAANVAGGLWPLLHPRSFEAVFGAKHDRWLQSTVAGLLVGNGLTQLSTADTDEGRRYARRLGVTTAATLLAVDLVQVPRRRIAKTYLLDAAMEVAWLLAWTRERTGSPSRTR